VESFGGAELLGWTPAALGELARDRGWTEPAIERLELGWDDREHRAIIPVRDEQGVQLGELHYDPTGTRTPKMRADAGVPRALFPPPEMIGEQELGPGGTAWLIEGEPDTVRAWALGLVAFGVPGAGNWRAEWAARFAGRRWEVAVLFDCDATGREHAARAAADLTAAGVTARVVELDPDRDDGYDLTDWARPAGVAELAGARDALQAIAAAVDPYQPPPAPTDRPWRSLTWSQFRDEAPPAHRWLIDGLLPEGALVFIAGPPKRGKTWVGIGIALALALGHPFAPAAAGTSLADPFAGHPVPDARDVLYLALEGSQTGLRTRIGALARGHDVDPDGRALDRLHMLYRPRPFDLAELATADWLREEAIETSAALVLVDVLRAAARFDENAAADFGRLRDHLEPLLNAGTTVILLHHFGKLTDQQRERSPGERMAGTGAMYGALDVGLLITKSEDGARRLKVEIEARDFAAPDALGLVIAGDGGGKHGGFRYGDRAQLVTDATAADDVDYVTEVEQLLADGTWRGGDAIAAELGRTRKTIEAALAADHERRIVRWDRDGRELDPPMAWNARPWGTAAMYEKARLARSEAEPSLFEDGAKGSVRPGPSGPSPLGELGPKGSVPLTGGTEGTEPFGEPSSGATEP
jgi:AAA domain